MGGSHSKADALITNDLGASEERDREGSAACGCLPLPFSGRGALSPASSRGGLGGGGRSDSYTALFGRGGEDGFGTPLPDTPEPVRRMRAAAAGDYRDGLGFGRGDEGWEEKKSGSFAGGRGPPRDDPTGDSRFDGLEKEDSGMFLYESAQGSGRGGVEVRDWMRGGIAPPGAVIDDGPDAESKLYEKYEMLEILGVGSTATCHRCVERSTGRSRACKIVDRTQIDPRYQTMMDQFHTEIKTLKSLQHPNIIHLYDVFVTDDRIYIVMELMEGGELFDYVVQKGTLTEEEASRIVRKVTSALVYMHSKNVIHRDLKPENLLLTHKPRSILDIEVKIIDFGLSKILSEGVAASSFLGTRGYLAPEMLQRRNYTKSVDAWALGVIVFVLLCGCIPFDDDCHTIPTTPDLNARFQLRFPRWANDLSDSAKDLLGRLLCVDSHERYTAEQALQHQWVRGETASRDILLQIPGRIKPSPGNTRGKNSSSQATKDHVSQMVANRAIANAQRQRAARTPSKARVRKKSI